jgi:hypothetical protein
MRPELFPSVPIATSPVEEQRRQAGWISRAAAPIEERRRTRAAVLAELDALPSGSFSRLIAGAPHRLVAEVAPLRRRPVVAVPGSHYPSLARIRSARRVPQGRSRGRGSELAEPVPRRAG